jgi:hypothetical protein
MRLVMHCHIATDYLRVMLMYKLMAVAWISTEKQLLVLEQVMVFYVIFST